MLDVSSNCKFAGLGSMNIGISEMDKVSIRQEPVASCGRLRSRSLYNSDDPKSSPGSAEVDRSHIRPRSRSFYSFETSEELREGNFTRSNAMRQRTRSLLQNEEKKTEKAKESTAARPPSKRSKANSSTNPNKDLAGSRGSLKNVPMMTISEADNWEISSCSGMKYGQYVDWEKIDPEAAVRYQKILKSDHNELKAMGRSGYWAMPHTLRAKAYNHIIQSISGRSPTSDADAYHELANRLFGEHKISTHPFPSFMEDGEIPRYCLSKAGLNSVKKVLLCVSKHAPDVSFCPILPSLVSLLLHFSEDEAMCFHSIRTLVEYKDPKKRYIDQTFLTYRASCMTFGDLANKYCRGIRKLIASSYQNLFEFYSDWIMWIFGALPFTYAIRVLDVYLMEGYKMLYRVALALLSLYKVSVSSRVAHVDDFRQDMKSFVQNVARHSTTEGLLKRAFDILLPTRRELNFLFNANKDALMHKGMHQKSSYQTVDLGNFNSAVVTKTEMRVVWAWIPERFALFSPIRLYSTNDHGRSLATLYSQIEGHKPTVLLLKTVDEEVCGAYLSSDWIQRRNQKDGQRFFGTGECFVFTLRPGMERYQRTVLYISGMLGKMDSSQQPGTTSSSSYSSISSSSSSSMTETKVPSGASSTPPYPVYPASTPQDPRIPTASFTSSQLKSAMFMAGDDQRLLVGGDRGHALCLPADLTGGYTEPCDTFESPPLCKACFRIQSLEVWGIKD